MISYLEFDKPVASLEERITEMRSLDVNHQVDVAHEIERLEAKIAELLASTYASLTPWQKTQVARHPQRPHFRDYVEHAFTDFMPLGGDRAYGDDAPPLSDENAERLVSEERQTSLAAIPLTALLLGVFATLGWLVRRRNGGR